MGVNELVYDFAMSILPVQGELSLHIFFSTTIEDDQDEYRPIIDQQLKSESLRSVPESVGSLEQHKISRVTEWINTTQPSKVSVTFFQELVCGRISY